MGIDPATTSYVITTGILSAIAADILEHHAKDLEDTVAGRLLKWGGLIRPDFNDRLQDAIKKALQLFFQTHPQYSLTGIEAFFRDPEVARQIGDYILNRKPIDQLQVQQALDRHLMGDAITVLLIRQRKLIPQSIIPDFLICYRRVLNAQLSIAEMSLLLEILDQSDRVLAEIKASEVRMKAYLDELLKTKLSPQALQAASQINQKHGAADLIQEMDTAKLVQPDEAVHTIQKRLQSLPVLFRDGLCKGRLLQAAPHEYFVSHGFEPDTLIDWRKTLTETLAQASKTSETLKPYFSGDTLIGGYRLCGICEKLYATRFSIFLLPPSQDRNVYLELGIALGLGTPFLLILPREASPPAILEGLSNYVSDGTFRTIRQQLPGKLGKIEEYNFAVVHLIKNLPAAGSQPNYLVAAGNLFDDADVEWTIADTIKEKYPRVGALSLTPELEKADASWMLEHLIDTIQTTRFAIYRVNEESSPTTFLALGISIALNRPFLMVRKGGSEVPTDLRGIGLFQFSSFTMLEKDFIARHQSFFDRHAKQ